MQPPGHKDQIHLSFKKGIYNRAIKIMDRLSIDSIAIMFF